MRSRKPPRPATPFTVRLPGFVGDAAIGADEVGLGQVVSRAAAGIGIRPCGGCARRAASLDRWVVFTRRPR